VSVGTQLRWECGVDPDGDTVIFDVYFQAEVSNPQLVGSVTEPVYMPPAVLAAGTLHYWRIVARDSRGAETSGPVWNFRTDPNVPPSAPCEPVPEDGGVVHQEEVILRWRCGVDPHGDPVRFRVYVGGTPEPETFLGQTQWGGLPMLVYWHVPMGTTYWRVVAVDINGGSTPGPVWSFTRE